MIKVVPIEQVIPLPDSSSAYSVRKMKAVLLKQGQIEPLQVRAAGDSFSPFHADPWANEIIHAARELGWPTLLIGITDTYEE